MTLLASGSEAYVESQEDGRQIPALWYYWVIPC